MFEIGGLLDPVGRLWGVGAALALLAYLPNAAIKRGRWLLLILALLNLFLAVISTIHMARADLLTYSVFLSAAIHAVIFFGLGLLAVFIGKTMSRKKE